MLYFASNIIVVIYYLLITSIRLQILQLSLQFDKKNALKL